MTLALRPIQVRLAVAYLAHAEHNASPHLLDFPNCIPGNSFSRIGTKCNHFTHQYTVMWENIRKFYDKNKFSELCDAEIKERAAVAMSIGFTTKSGIVIPAETVHKARKTWQTNGWFRYEQRRNGRRQVAYKYGPWVLMAIITCGASASNPPN